MRQKSFQENNEADFVCINIRGKKFQRKNLESMNNKLFQRDKQLRSSNKSKTWNI